MQVINADKCKFLDSTPSIGRYLVEFRIILFDKCIIYDEWKIKHDENKTLQNSIAIKEKFS